MSEIRLEHLEYSYLDHGQRSKALSDVDVIIGEGQFVCLLGRSGCGKTTLLHLAAGLERPERGQVVIGGKPVTAPDTDRAVVFQNDTLFPWMTARKNVEFGIRHARKELGKSEVRALAEEFLGKVGMADAMDKYPYQLSGGMQQRVAIARALSMDTDILLLDEPFGALDARNRQDLQELLVSLWSAGEHRKTVLFVTHDIGEAALLADRILYMTPGRIAADVAVSLPRPRDARSEEMKHLREQLLALFYESREEAAYEKGM